MNGMRVVSAMEFRDRLGIDVAGLGLHQHAILEMCFELPLQRDEKRRAVVAMPVGEATRHDLGIVDLHFDVRVLRDRRIELVEQHMTEEAAPGRNQAVELELEVLVVVGRMHLRCLRPWRSG